MNRNFTRLVCAGIASFCMMSAMGQESMPVEKAFGERIVPSERISLRASEKERPDSVVLYYDDGERITSYIPIMFGADVYYNDYNKSWMLTMDHFYLSVIDEERVSDVKYNSEEQVESYIWLRGTDNYGLRKFKYNTNGYLLSSETSYRSGSTTEWVYSFKTDYIYDDYDNWVGVKSYTADGKSIGEQYSAHVDSKGRIVYSIVTNGMLTIGGRTPEIRYYIWYYSDHTPNVETANNTPIGDANEGGFDLNVNVPADSIASGSVTVTLPEGLTLDETNTALAVDVAGLFDLTITKQEDNSWLIGIKLKPSSKSGALRADEAIGTMLHVAYKVEDTLPRGTYNISVNNILFETPFGNMIPEPAIIVPANINRWAVANEEISNPEITAYIADHTLYIGTNQPDEVSIYTVNGVKVYEATVQPGTTTVSTASLPQGMLILQGKSGWVRKVINK